MINEGTTSGYGQGLGRGWQIFWSWELVGCPDYGTIEWENFAKSWRPNAKF